MGCTSSTVNVPESQSSTTENMANNVTCEEKSKKDNDIITSNYCNLKELEQTQVLPDCEITKNLTQIPSDDNIKSSDEKFDVENKDVEDIIPTEKHDDPIHVTESSPLKDNFVSLKVVVEKLIPVNTDEDDQITNVTETQNVDLDRQIEEIIMESNASEDVEVELNEDEAKESPSPTQSEDSRATRWEALADIAAELPPSLAVDPLTGQIYSLTK